MSKSYFIYIKALVSIRVKPIFSFVVFLLFGTVPFLSLHGQQLSIQEATQYLETTINDELSLQRNIYPGTKKISIRLVDNLFSIKYLWKGNKDILQPNYQNSNLDYNEITFNALQISQVFKKKYKTSYTIAAKCESGTKSCFTMEAEAIQLTFSREFCDRPNAINHYDFLHLFYLKNNYKRDKVFTIFNYIIYELKKQNNLLADNEQEFIINATKEIVSVPLKAQNGVSYLMIDLSGIRVSAILDSGSSDVSVPKTLEEELKRKGIIDSGNYLTPGLYTIADGSIVKSERFVIPHIKVNDTSVENVKCSVNQSDEVLLLGRSFLDSFKSWKIDNRSNKLVLEI